METVQVALDFTLTQGLFTLAIHERFEARATALVGPSGAGKTTVLDAIAGLRRPDGGEIKIGTRQLFSSDGVDVPSRRRNIGYVPQDVALFPHMNARRNIFYGVARGESIPSQKVMQILEIEPFLERAVGGLSGGERQRVAIARALMSAPDLLLLDEPLAAVDMALRQRILSYIARILDELRVPIIYVSHAENEVQRIAEWVIVLERGRVSKAGPPDKVLGSSLLTLGNER